MSIRISIFAAAWFACALSAFADMPENEARCEIGEQRSETWQNVDCAKTDTCDLKEFKFFMRRSDCQYDTGIEPSTLMVAGYETRSPAAIEKYLIGQFIRGCVYEIDKGADGKETLNWAVARSFFDQTVTFKHTEWVIDSIDHDPSYWSPPYPGASRVGSYFGADISDVFNTSKWVKYAQLRPENSSLFVYDAPSSGTYFGSGAYSDQPLTARNASLELKTCIYRAKDVPLRVKKPTDLDFSVPLHCFEWQVKDIYDFEKKMFTHPKEIASVCMQ